jgi:hypothetical protein
MTDTTRNGLPRSGTRAASARGRERGAAGGGGQDDIADQRGVLYGLHAILRLP